MKIMYTYGFNNNHLYAGRYPGLCRDMIFKVDCYCPFTAFCGVLLPGLFV